MTDANSRRFAPSMHRSDTASFPDLKVGVIGTRHVHADGFARAAADLGASIVGAWEPDSDARNTWERSPLLERDEVLERADAVFVAGTNAERVDGVIAALEAGVPVLSEKPVAASHADLERLIAATTSAGSDARYMTALPVRFAGALQRARTAIEAGAIGTPLAGRGTNHGQFPGGWFGQMSEAGGGAVMDHTVHVSDALCWLLDDRIVEVYAEATRRLHDDIDVDDCGVLTFGFESGLFASLDASWSRPVSFPTWGDVWIELVGTDGRLVIDPMVRHLDIYDDRAGKLRHEPYPDEDMGHTMMTAFLTYARDGGDSPVPLAQGVHASDVIFAAYDSIKSGQVVPVLDRAAAPA